VVLRIIGFTGKTARIGGRKAEKIILKPGIFQQNLRFLVGWWITSSCEQRRYSRRRSFKIVSEKKYKKMQFFEIFP
jgi:hypothetical protein